MATIGADVGAQQNDSTTTPASAAPQVADDGWQWVSPDQSGMKIQMPGEPKISSSVIRPLPERDLVVHMAMTPYQNGSALFLVGYHDLDFTPSETEKINDVLDGGVKGTVLNVLGRITQLESITIGEHPARHFEYAGKRFNQQIRGTSRIVVVGKRVFQITVLYKPEVDVAAEAQRFFESFELLAGEDDAGADLDDPPARSDQQQSP